MKIAIVGAAGQVGAGVLRRLGARRDLAVWGITRNEFSAAPLRHRGFEIRVGSVGDSADCGRLLQGADMVVNAALHIGLPGKSRGENERILRGLIAQARSAVVVHLSTVAVYGSCHDRSFSTFDRPRGDSTYAREKLRHDRYALVLAKRSSTRLAVVRLGHVYGPGQGLSRQIFADLEAGRALLPFDGKLPSNAVHIERLSDALPGLAGDDRIPVRNAVNAPQITWRELYDEHAHAGRLPPAGAMPDAGSRAMLETFRARMRRSIAGRFAADVASWLRRLPLKSLADAQGLREAMEGIMLSLPRQFEETVYVRYQGFAARQRIVSGGTVATPPWYLADAVPGPNLLVELSSDDESRRRSAEAAALRVWYDSFSAPQWAVARA